MGVRERGELGAEIVQAGTGGLETGELELRGLLEALGQSYAEKRE